MHPRSLAAPVLKQLVERLGQRYLGPPPSGGVQLRRVASHLWHVGSSKQLRVLGDGHRVSRSHQQAVRQLTDASRDATAHVVGLTGAACARQQPVGPHHISHVRKVALRLHVPGRHQRGPGAFVVGDPRGQRGGHETVTLAWPEMIERPGPDHLKPRAVTGLEAHHLRGSLARSVRSHRPKRGRLCNREAGVAHSAIYVRARHRNHPPRAGAASGGQHVERALYVDAQRGYRLGPARAHIGLGRQVVHGFGPALPELGRQRPRVGDLGAAGGHLIAGAEQMMQQVPAREPGRAGYDCPHPIGPLVAHVTRIEAHNTAHGRVTRCPRATLRI